MAEAVFTAKDKANLEALTEEIPKIREMLEGFPKIVSRMESLEETLEILSDKEAMRNIKAAQKDIKEGHVCSWEEALKELSINEKDL
ncbi:MAG: hypothetical protein LBI09_02750 [Nitrososphaerota archaeon]|jgi:hypothetical protein|nr:hypothetical protein [Nitrososphaerota archaeon]